MVCDFYLNCGLIFIEFVIWGHIPYCLPFSSYVVFDFGFVACEWKFKSCYHFRYFFCECISHLMTLNVHLARNPCQDHCFAKVF